MYRLVDFTSKQPVQAGDLVFAGVDSPWEVEMNIDIIKRSINIDHFMSTPPCLSKYLPLMPVNAPVNFVSLKEHATPLVKSKYVGQRLGLDLYFKVEGKNPTGSFKDRGSAVEMTVAKELGAKAVVLASTGNMAASCACYAAAANMPCFVIVPEGVPLSKLAQVISFGGQIVQVKGSYNDAANLAYSIAKEKGFYLAGDYAFRVEGQKTAAFEMVDQLLYQAPEVVVVPMGCGTNMAAYAKGFKEYHQLGLVDKPPTLVGVQAQGARAVVNSYEKKAAGIEPLKTCDTLASAIAVPDPVDGVKALAAIYDTGGEAGAVSDQEILAAQYLLSREEGLFVETASAATVAYLMKTRERGQFTGKKVVCVLSGDGLKEPSVVLNAAIKPPTIDPCEQAFNQWYDSDILTDKARVPTSFEIFEDTDEGAYNGFAQI